MIKLYNYFKTFWLEEVKISYFLLISCFIAVAIFLEYYLNLTDLFIEPHKRTIKHFFYNIVFYGLPLFFSVLSYIFFYKKWNLTRDYSFWLLLLIITCAFSFRTSFYQHRVWVLELNNGVFDLFLLKCSTQAFKALFIFAFVFCFWIFSGDRNRVEFYGFRLRGIDTKPYFIMLLLMIPLIVFASTQSDFLRKYPTFAKLVTENSIVSNIFLRIGLYELLYGLDYVAIELFFRGFMIYALSKYLGRGAILPMVSMYVFIHFGKPLGETVSSFFGGIILGVIAFETKSIVGGVIIHLGIAYMMEIGGYIGNLLSSK